MRYLKFMTFVLLALVGSSCQTNQRCVPCDVVDETYVHKYGVEIDPDDWNSRGQHGQIVSTLKSGVVVSKSYSSGVLEGDTVYTMPRSEAVDKVENYSQGSLNKETYKYASGVPKKEIVHTSPTSQTIKTWYDSGTPMSVEEYDNGRLMQAQYFTASHQIEAQVVDREGTRVVRDDYGQRIAMDTIHKGLLTTQTTYHPNDVPAEVKTFSNNQVNGQKRTFYPGGEPNSIEMWTNGNQDGITTIFQNGEIAAEVPYVNGKKNGVEKHFKDGKTVFEEITWLNDQKHGPSKIYVGDKVQINWFFQDKPVSKVGFDNLSHPQFL